VTEHATELAPIGRPSWKGLVRRDVVGALIRYRVMAFIVGTGLLILVFVAVPLQYGANINLVAEIVGTMHGYLYIVYLVAAADLARRAHWRLLRIVMVVAAGFLPFLAFVVEHRVYRQMQTEWARGPSAARSPELRRGRRAPRESRSEPSGRTAPHRTDPPW
jgi:integral membrane protein